MFRPKSSTQAEFAALKAQLRRSSAGSARFSRDNQDYSAVLSGEENDTPSIRESSTKRPGFLDRFRSPKRKHDISSDRQSMYQRRGHSYISPMEPVLNEGDRKVFSSTPKAVLLWDDSFNKVVSTTKREAKADWGAVNILYESKTLAGGEQEMDVPEEHLDTEGGFEYRKIFMLFKDEMWIIIVLTLFKIFENVVSIVQPIFSGLLTDTLVCRQTVFDQWTTYNALAGAISQAAYEAKLDADLSFCREQMQVTLGNDCCTGTERSSQSGVYSLALLLAPGLRNNFQGFARVQDLILVEVYFTLVSLFVRLLLDFGSAFFMQKFQGSLQRKVFDAFLAQDMGFFDARPTGVLLSRLMNDTSMVQGVAVIFSMVVRIISTLCFSASVAYSLNPSLFYLFLGLIPFEFYWMYREGLFSRHWLLVQNTRMGKHYQVMQEILDKIKHIKVFNGVQAALKQFANSLQLNFRIEAYVTYVTTFGFSLILSLYQNIFQYSLQFISSRLILQLPNQPGARPFSVPADTLFSFGQYQIFIQYATNMKDAIGEFYRIREETNKILVVSQTMVYYLYRKPVGGSEKMQGPGFVSRMRDVDPTIRFENVSFAYPSRPGLPVLKKFSVEFPANKFSCIIGNSGGGKSTTMGLILRMYEPSSGRIWLGKHEYNTVNLTFLRECFAYVTQEPVLFSCTIRENLRYANPLATNEQISAALQDAGCSSIIESLPDGLDTKLAGLSAAGSGLSVGQKQRIAIARAFLRPSPILLLDEPTAALDAKSEELVTAAIVKLVKNRTAIMITHRCHPPAALFITPHSRAQISFNHSMTSVRYCDNVVVILDGACAEHGPPSELLQRPGSVFSSFIRQHSEASGRIAGLAAQAGDDEGGGDDFDLLRRISEDPNGHDE